MTLQELLGFERGNNRGSDPETRGPLGMLWVEQMSALAVESPNRIVRDSVRGMLEAEVGAVTGGRRFDAIRSSVETAYGSLRTPATGKSRGELAAAEARLAAAAAARQQAETSYREYEQALNDLDGVKARLRTRATACKRSRPPPARAARSTHGRPWASSKPASAPCKATPLCQLIRASSTRSRASSGTRSRRSQGSRRGRSRSTSS